MRYGLGIKLLISFLVGGVAVLYKFKVNPKLNKSEVSSIIKVPRPFIFDIVSNPKNVPTVSSLILNYFLLPYHVIIHSLSKT